MAEFRLGRIKFVWQGDWTPGTTYVVDDVVNNGGKSYICIVNHTASSTFVADSDIIPPKWHLVADGLRWTGDWAPTTYYEKGDQVKYGGTVYICNTPHTSQTYLEDDQSSWDLLATSFDWQGEWAYGTRYKVNDFVSYGGKTYFCNTAHAAPVATADLAVTAATGDGISATLTFAAQVIPPFAVGSTIDVSGSDPSSLDATGAVVTACTTTTVTYANATDTALTPYVDGAVISGTNLVGLEATQSNWTVFNEGLEFVGTWTTGDRYKLNDLVKFGASTWICTAPHTATTNFDETKFSIFVEGLQFEDSWDINTGYQIGDVVTYGGYSYIAQRNNTGSNPSTGTDAALDWELYTTGFNFVGEYDNATLYKVGDVIRLGGYSYLCIADSTGNIPPNTSYWNRLNSGVRWTDESEVYTNVATTATVGVGTTATFDITRQGTMYSVVINTGGINYEIGDELVVFGTDIGGLSPVNDLKIEVTSVSAGEIDGVDISSGYSVTWTNGQDYVLGDVVFFGASSYICIQEHTADTATNRPDVDTSATYWNLFAAGSESSILTVEGDTYYYGENGPTRLPIGTDGQILRVSEGYPQWAYYGVINNLVYVATDGIDALDDGRGLSVDKPWKTIRYACNQIEKGYHNRTATDLLEKNKQFIMKEVSNWVDYTYSVTITASNAATGAFTCNSTENLAVDMPIEFDGTLGGVTAGTKYFVAQIIDSDEFTITDEIGNPIISLTTDTGSMTGQLSYDYAYCQRDVGILVEALVADLGRGGNEELTAAARAYYTTAGTNYINTNFGEQINVTVSAYNYLKTLVSNVLSNVAPAMNYQDLNNVAHAEQASQVFNGAVEDAAVITSATALLDIVTNGLLAGDRAKIPAAIFSNTTISVKTGTFYEVLPIVIPKNTAVVGDELRSTVINPNQPIAGLSADKAKTTSAINRFKAIIPNIVANNVVDASDFNTATQQYVYNNNESILETSANTNAGIIANILENGLGAVPSYTLPTPTDFDAGYADAVRLLELNKEFIQDEVEAYMVANYNSVWAGLGAAGQAACTRDIGYIVDALTYDLTYGGNLETVVAARSYYSNGTFVEPSSEKSAALAVQLYVKSFIGYIIQGDNSSWTALNSTTVQDISGTAGSAAAASDAEDRIQEVHDTIDTGTTPTEILPDTSWCHPSVISAVNTVQAAKSAIQTDAIRWVNVNYPELEFDEALCSRDVGYAVDALCYDALFGTSFRSIKVGMSYQRAITSAQYVLAEQLEESVGIMKYVGDAVQQKTAGTAILNSSINTITNVIANGVDAAPTLFYPDPDNYDIGYYNARRLINANKEFLVAEVTAWIAAQVAGGAGIWSGFTYDVASCERDTRYIIDALAYDLTYGGNLATVIAARSYYSYGVAVNGAEEEQSKATWLYVQSIIGYIATGDNSSWTKTPANAETQDISGTAGSAAAVTFAEDRIQEVHDTIDTGTSPTTIAPSLTWVDSSLTDINTTVQAAKAHIQEGAIAWVNEVFPTLVYNEVTCSRDVGYIVDALCYDVMFKSNFLSTWNGLSYRRGITSTNVVLNDQLNQTLGLVGYVGASVKELAFNQIGSTGNNIAISRVRKSVNAIYDALNNGVDGSPAELMPAPIGADSDYIDGRDKLADNYDFIKADVENYLNNNENALWTSLSTAQKDACKRDVGYILDAIRYDLTYGGNTQSLIAGSAYYSGINLTIANDELAATLAAYTHLKSIVDDIVQNNPVTPQAGNGVSQDQTGTGDTTGDAAVFAQARVQDVMDWITNGSAPTAITPDTSWVHWALVDGFESLQARKAEIQLDGLGHNQKFFQDIDYNEDLCSRDIGYMVDAIGYDMMFGSNFAGITAGRSYHRNLTSTNVVLDIQKDVSLSLTSFLFDRTKVHATGGAIGTATTILTDAANTINGGALKRYLWPAVSTTDVENFAAGKLIFDNKEFLQAEVLAYIKENYPAVEYNQAVCARDVGYIIDALRYDLTYGGNYGSKQAGIAYYSRLTTDLQIDTNDKTATLAAYAQLKTAVQAIASGNAYTAIQTKVSQITGPTGDAGSSTTVGTLMDVMTDIVDQGIASGAPQVTIDTIAGGNVITTSAAHGLAVNDQIIPRSDANGFVSGKVYYVKTVPAADEITVTASLLGDEKTDFTDGTGIALVAETTSMPTITSAGATLRTQAGNLTVEKSTIQNDIIAYIATNYPNLDYDSDTCARDIGYVIDSVAFDMLLGSNFQTTKSGLAYYQAQASLAIGTEQKRPTLNSFRRLQDSIRSILENYAPSLNSAMRNMSDFINILDKGDEVTPFVTGTSTYDNNIAVGNAIEAIRSNVEFLENEGTGWIKYTFGGTVQSTDAATSTVQCDRPHNLEPGDPITFADITVTTSAVEVSSVDNTITLLSTEGIYVGSTISFSGDNSLGNITDGSTYFILSIEGDKITVSLTYGGSVENPGTATGLITATAGVPIASITTGETYYILETPTTSSFTFSTSTDGTPQPVTDDQGVMIVHYAFDETACKRDMREYVEALVYDMKWPGNYRSTRAAVLYLNAITGSEHSDMFHVSNASGLRNCTMRGLSGDLTALNDYDTRRPTAGAFVALNPGYGPQDKKVWVTSRSHYSQNCTMFGEGCTGAKIDAALHKYGNKSMVKNDFTTIISDGIGVWCTGQDSLTELVSVFNYYGYAGYLAELGGRIRATNGNSSYGTYGVIAEGVDSHETPIYGTMDNQYFQAQLDTTITDGLDEVLRIEFANAGSHYTNVAYTISGSGYNAAAIGDEFRDASCFETRLVDLDDDKGVGGSLYETAANAAQQGDLYSITIAATDTALNNAYSGMRVQLTAGTGVGQFANILTYGAGSKIATVTKPRFDAIEVTNTTATTNVLTVADTSTLWVGMPIVFGGTTFGNIVEGTTYFVETVASGTTFTIEDSGGTTVTLATATGSMMAYESGWEHTVPGFAIENNLDLTTQYTIEPAISYSAPGFTNVSASVMPSSATWDNMVFGDGKYLAIANGSNATAYTDDGVTWQSAGTLSASASWADVVYGGGYGATATATVGGFGGQGAVFEAVLGVPNTTGAATEDQIASVRVIDGGVGYSTPPVIVFTPVNGGIGATATCAVLDGKIVDVTVTVPGSGYDEAPIVSAATDRVTTVTVGNWGRDYFSTAQVDIEAPFTGTAFSGGASITQDDIIYHVDSGTTNWYQAVSGGTLAATGPVHTSGTVANGTASLLYIGTSAEVSAVMANAGVSSITIDDTGVGYTFTPAVTITDTAARYVAVASSTGDNCYTTRNGIANGDAWVAGTGTGKTDLVAVTYGNGVYVAVGGTSSCVSSVNGSLWTSRTIGSLSSGTYVDVAYGNQTFIAIGSDGSVAKSTNGNSWTAGGSLPSNIGWSSVTYGNGRFVAIRSDGADVAYSLDKGTTWTSANEGYNSSGLIGVQSIVRSITYGQGLFVVLHDNSALTSPDGLVWTSHTGLSSDLTSITFGNINNNPMFIAPKTNASTSIEKIYTGARATGRVTVADEIVTQIRMLEPGSGYPKGNVTGITGSGTNIITVDNTINLEDNQVVMFTGGHYTSENGSVEIEKSYYIIAGSITATQFQITDTLGSTTPVELTTATPTDLVYRAGPTAVITDPNNVNDAAIRVRMGDGALGNPSFTNRGSENATATTEAQGDGYSDLFQPSAFINIAGLYDIPEAGANVEFESLPGVYFKLVVVTNELGELGDKTAQFQINPALSVLQAPKHGDRVTTRLKYSQVRLTGHDYLYIGTGGKEQTNYPNVDISKAITANQAVFSNGGRVFFTSTDQDGNFNVGNLFGVQQATGTATLNASAFNLSGLNSLQLGSVELGVGSAIITQFSTDPFFTADSDNVVPTQRAIKAYITAQIGGGQSSLNVNTLTSGIVYVAGDSISTTTGEGIQVTSKMNFTGGIDGAPVALGFFMQR